MGLKLRTPIHRRIRQDKRTRRFSDLVLQRSVIVVATLLLGFANIVSINNSTTNAVSSEWYAAGWDKVSAGSAANACGISLSTVYCWGFTFGSTNRDLTSPTAIDTGGVFAGKTVTDISTAYDHSCAVADGAVYCWGLGTNGQLGDGSLSNTNTPIAVDTSGVLNGKTVTAVAVSMYNSCVIANGSVYCWGLNLQGDLGDNSTTMRPTPVAIDTTNILSGKTVTKLSMGSGGGCVIASGGPYCWTQRPGNGLAYGGGPRPIVAVSTSGVLNGKTITDITAGNSSCAVASGNVYCWGFDSNGELGTGGTGTQDTPVAVDTSGVLNGKTVTALSQGDNIGHCVIADGKAYCWGFNANAQLGDGTQIDRNVPVAVDTSGVLNGKTIASIVSSQRQSCVLSVTTAYCWGSQAYIGDGTTTGSLTPLEVKPHAPQINSISPSSIPVNQSGTIINIYGNFFDSANSSVLIGGMSATVLSRSTTYISAYIPASSTLGFVNVEVDNPDGQSSVLTNGFEYVLPPPPAVSSVSPTTITTNTAGQDIYIYGSDFDSSNASVMIGGVPAIVTSRASNFIVATIPSSSTPGSVNVEVDNPDGQSSVLTNGFEYVLPPSPTISSIYPSPATGLTTGGGTLYIYGNDFDNPTVTIGGNAATVTNSASYYIELTVPPSAVAGVVDITVTNQDGQSVTSTGAYEYVQTKLLSNQFKSTFGATGTGAGQFSWPEGITADHDGNLYITDNGNSRVEVFDKDGAYLRQFGAQGSGDGQFDYPSAIKIGSDGNIYVLDTNNLRVQVFSKTGTYIRQIDISASGYAEGMAFNSRGDMYITDCGTESTVKVYKSDGTYLRTLGSDGTGDGQFNCSYAVTVDSNDNVYVSDSNNYRIQVFDKNDNFIRKFGSQGIGEGQFGWVEDLTIDSSGNVLVVDSDNDRIQVFTANGVYLGQIGITGQGNGQLNWPSSIAIGANGDLYVTDARNDRVQVFEGMKPASQPVSVPVSEPSKKVPAPTSGSKQDVADSSTTDLAETVPTVTINGDDTPLTGDPVIPKRPTFSGVATPFAEVVVTVHSDPVVCKTTADAEGKWSCTLDRDLPAGSHHVTIELTNQDGTKTTLGPYAVTVKGGDTVDSSQTADKNASKPAKNDDFGTMPLYLGAAVVVIIVLAITALLIRKRVNRAI